MWSWLICKASWKCFFFACCLRFILECHRSLGDCCDLLLWRGVFLSEWYRFNVVQFLLIDKCCPMLRLVETHTIGWSRSSSGNLLNGIEASSIFIQWLWTCWKAYQRSTSHDTLFNTCLNDLQSRVCNSAFGNVLIHRPVGSIIRSSRILWVTWCEVYFPKISLIFFQPHMSIKIAVRILQK